MVLATKPAAAGPPAPSARAGPVDVGAPPKALRMAFPMPAKRFTQDGIPQLPRQRGNAQSAVKEAALPKRRCAWTANDSNLECNDKSEFKSVLRIDTDTTSGASFSGKGTNGSASTMKRS